MLFSLSVSSARSNPPDPSSAPSEKIKAACTVIEENIKKNNNIKKYVKTSIQMGYKACPVITCSVKAKGNIEQIITGAVEAGTTTDVVSRCAIDAGARPQEVAAILTSVSLPGICYLLPEDQPTPQPPLPQPTPPLPPLSPSIP